ncbi:hypothetical protein L9F63_014456 [Diploptera punctata]|uniref:C2H2-type domain-containing protein n=1 Tax=Diploptera punctata TaxID=6984 RepID=A0AAD8A7V4_DIPPU|nr:hypothetical protein L9F63_014456 [Diploptera punctata]
MADCYDVDVERSDEPSASTSSLPFGIGGYGKSHGAPNPVAMFYPQLSGYEIHPLLLTQRRRAAQDKLQIDDTSDAESSALSLVTSPMHKELLRQSFKQKQKTTKRKAVDNDQGDISTVPTPENFPEIITGDTDTSDYAAKPRKSFYCRACGKAFKFQTSLLRHNNKVHISKYQCPTCSRVFSRQAYLDVHTSKQGSSCYIGSGFANPTIISSPKSDSNSNMSKNASEFSSNVKFEKNVSQSE